MASVGAGTRRGRPRDGQLDDVIVDATVAEVAAKGWGATTIEGIAARAGVGKATIYRRWPTKVDLFQFVSTRIVSPAVDVDSGALADDLLAVLGPMAEMLSQPDVAGLLPALLAEANGDDAIRATVDTFATQRRQAAIDAVDRAIRRGEAAPDTDAEALVDMLAGGLVYRRLLLRQPIDRDTVAGLIRQSLRAVPSSHDPEERR